MVLILHGEAGSWDELIIAIFAFGVLWIAVKLAGRKPAAEEDEAEPTSEASDPMGEEQPESAVPPAAPRA
jgi:hypothetical protein